MSFSCSVSFYGLTDSEKESAIHLLSQISLIHQDALAEWFMEQQLSDEYMKKKQEKEEKTYYTRNQKSA